MAELQFEEILAWRNLTVPPLLQDDGKPYVYPTKHRVIHLHHGSTEFYIVGYSTGWEGEDGDVAEILSPKEFLRRYSLERSP